MDLSYKQPDGTLPKICDAQDIYEVAHDLALERVKSKALNFLKVTCTPKNITARRLSCVTADPDHRLLTEFYSDYFTKHWHKIRDTDEHNEFMGQAEDGDDFVDIVRSFRDLMKKVELKV